ncbi:MULTISPECIES: gliding motility protein [unclassified Streptomyces]|uniref:gliding motility protein n=1 Tax=unclassified Streptomyces TaxID=2593676 RepID=UPI001BECF686|nr:MULTISPECIES: gliding motility protein [unclassified Streptomyces]MBT2404298.1 gliding motility protein [Streptomyces sp. ISL-21]MBT2458612.1 gliding motility protein [Streptomyces sp. ISL-86]MBT2611973.1 gliding motility protein [Streptomyces sp. ISL-87]
MGVFGRFFGRKDEASTEEVAAENLTAASEETEAETAEAEAPAAEAVEIPKQQSAEVAADSETGEGART